MKAKQLAISILISLGAGAVSGLLANASEVYSAIHRPPLSPPASVFPIVWTALYILMGVSAYLVYRSGSSNKKDALILYAIQLVVNFFWPLLFFNAQAYLMAFLWLALLWLLIFAVLYAFGKIDRRAAYLLIPYLVWVTFAGYLNLAVCLLN